MYDNVDSIGPYRHWDNNRSFRGTPIEQFTPATNPTLPAMQRFLLEPDRHYFTTSPIRRDIPMSPFPSLDTDSIAYLDSMPRTYNVPEHLPSPINSGPSSYTSSNWSDRQSTPLSSPDSSIVAHSPQLAYAEHFPYGYGGHQFSVVDQDVTNSPCVRLHDVQNYEDTQPEKVSFDDEQTAYYTPFPQEGYQPIEPDEMEPYAQDVVNGNDTIKVERRFVESPQFRRRQVQLPRSATSPRPQSNKISKRPGNKRRRSSLSQGANGARDTGNGQYNSNRAFPCPFTIYGCSSTFGSKNEWKRHVNTQHMRTGYWRCDQCDGGERKPNDFNRKDLFIQHVRRMHPLQPNKSTKTKINGQRSTKNDPEEQEMSDVASRCFKHIRSPPSKSGCLFCNVTFNGPNTWDERLEHIGKHMEAAKKDNDEPPNPSHWQEDEVLQEWLKKEGIIAMVGKSWALTEGRA